MSPLSKIIIQLGAPNHPDGSLSDIALDRANHTIALANQYSHARILCTGGKAPRFNATQRDHGNWVKQYLIERGVSAERFLTTAASLYTIDDARLSLPIVLEHCSSATILLNTSDFHIKRSAMIFNAIFKDFEIVACPATSSLSKDQLMKLAAHEQVAYQRDRATLGV